MRFFIFICFFLNNSYLFSNEIQGSYFDFFNEEVRIFFNKKYTYYVFNKVFYYFNIEENNFGKIILDVDLTSVHSCFFDGVNLILSTCNELFVFNLDGKLESYNKFSKSYKVYPKNIEFNNGIIYVIGFDNKIFAFTNDNIDYKKLNLLWMNNDFYTVTSAFNFEYYFNGDYMYLLIKDRFSIINNLNGRVEKNIYLKYHYDHLIYDKNKVILSTNMRFANINLEDFTFEEVNSINIGKNVYSVNYDNIVLGDSKYELNYVRRILGNNFYFAYRVENNDTKYLFIDDKNIEDNGVIKGFNISNVFFYGNKLFLIDGKNKKFRIF